MIYMTNHFTLRVCAILLMAAGYGWAGGHFIPPDAPLWAYLFQAMMLLILAVLSIGFLRSVAGLPGGTPARAKRNVLGLSIFAVLTLLINAANVVRGATQAGAFGSHNTFADLAPIGLIAGGDVSWLLSLLGRTTRTGRTTPTTPAG